MKRVLFFSWAMLGVAFSDARAAQNPFVFHVSDSADPEAQGFRVIGVTGDNFGNSPIIQLARYTGPGSSAGILSSISVSCASDASPSHENGCIYNANSQFVSVVLPNDGNLGTEAFSVSVKASQTGPASPITSRTVVNLPAIYFVEFDQIQPGEAFRIFGKNLVLRGATTSVSFVPAGGASGSALRAGVSAQNTDPTVLSVSAPESLKAGVTYQVEVEVSGTSITATDTMLARPLMNKLQNFGLNVPWQVDLPSKEFQVNAMSPPQDFYTRYSQFCTTGHASLNNKGEVVAGASQCVAFGNKSSYSHAMGDGISDDQPIIQALLYYVAAHVNADGSKGGVLYLPNGNYVLESNNANQCGFRLQSNSDVPCDGTVSSVPGDAPLQISNNSVLTIPPNVVLQGENQQNTRLFYGFGPVPTPGGVMANYYFHHATGIVLMGPADAKDTLQSDRALDNGIQSLSVINLNQIAGYVDPVSIDLKAWDVGVTGNVTGAAPSDCASVAQPVVQSLNQGSWEGFSVDTGDAALSKDDSTQVSETFISDVTFDFTHADAGVTITTGFNSPTGVSPGDHLALQGSTILRSNCELAGWAPLKMGGTQLSIKGNTINNYYSRNSELWGDHIVIEGNSFIRHRNQLPLFLGPNNANNGGLELGDSHLAVLNNTSDVIGIPPAVCVSKDRCLTQFLDNPTDLGGTIGAYDQYGENFLNQDVVAINSDMGTVGAGTNGTTFVGNSFNGQPWWSADPNPSDNLSLIPNGTLASSAIYAQWAQYTGRATGYTNISVGEMGHKIMIVGGPGAGQVRDIVRYTENNTLILDQPWDEPPSPGKSVYAVPAPGLIQVLFNGNTLRGSATGFVISQAQDVQIVNNRLEGDGAIWVSTGERNFTPSPPSNPASFINPSFAGRFNPGWNVSITGNSLTEAGPYGNNFPTPFPSSSSSPGTGNSGWYPLFPASISVTPSYVTDSEFPYGSGRLVSGVEIRNNTISLFPHLLLRGSQEPVGARGIAVTGPVPSPSPSQSPTPPTAALGTVMDSNTIKYIAEPNVPSTPLTINLSYQCQSGSGSVTPLNPQAKGADCPSGDTITLNPNESSADVAYLVYGTNLPVIWNPLISSSVNDVCAVHEMNAYSASWNPKDITIADLPKEMALEPPAVGSNGAPYYYCTKF